MILPKDPSDFYQKLVQTVKTNPENVRSTLPQIQSIYLESDEPTVHLACIYVFFARLFVQGISVKARTSKLIEKYGAMPMTSLDNPDDSKEEVLSSVLTYLGIFYSNHYQYDDGDRAIFRSIFSLIEGETNSFQIKLFALLFLVRQIGGEDDHVIHKIDWDDDIYAEALFLQYRKLYIDRVELWLSE